MSKRIQLVLIAIISVTAFGFAAYFFVPTSKSQVQHVQNVTPLNKTVCLNMIVKNESQVIERCLESCLPLIDYYVIVDTGSTDGTQEVIKNYMKKQGIPGEVHERPWVNFSHNRNEALDLAKGKADYVFVIDADEYLVYEPGFQKPALDKDYYWMFLTAGGTKWCKLQLMNNHLDWKFVGVLHEAVVPSADRSFEYLDKVKNIYTTDGARSKDPRKYEKDAEVLEAALKIEPNDSRYVFYLAQSYNHAGNYPKAIENYEKLITMRGGQDAEVYEAMMQIGLLQEKLKEPSDVIIKSFKRACLYMNRRAEAFYHLARYYRELGDFTKSYQVAAIGMTIPLPRDIFFIQEWIYEYGIALEYSISAYWIDRFQDCQSASVSLLKRELPQHVRECVERNLGFANAKLLEVVCSD